MNTFCFLFIFHLMPLLLVTALTDNEDDGESGLLIWFVASSFF